MFNLCYIPVNCFIVSTVLFGCLREKENDASGLPATLTELYETAVAHFHKHHRRKFDGMSTQVGKNNLQLLAYNGIESRKLIFSDEVVDQEMKRSGLLNSLYNPVYPVKVQYCFIHLTMQEFLATKHVTETFTPGQILYSMW